MDPILDCCALDGVAAISQLSIYFRVCVKNYLVRRIQAMLKQWFDKPILFRDAMRHTNTVISGSTALAFAIGADWESHDLDLWTPRGMSRQTMVAHLVHVEGYTITTVYENGHQVPVGGGDDPVTLPIAAGGPVAYQNNRIRSVTKLCKMVFDKKHGFDMPRFVDVVESATEHAISPILKFHSSIVMNWITADSIVVTYPKLTFAKMAIVNERIHISRSRQKLWRDKYTERGIQFLVDSSTLAGGCGAACPAVWRNTKDIGNMTIYFGDSDQIEVEEAELHWGMSLATDAWYGGNERKCYNPYCPRYLTVLPRRGGERPRLGAVVIDE